MWRFTSTVSMKERNRRPSGIENCIAKEYGCTQSGETQDDVCRVSVGGWVNPVPLTEICTKIDWGRVEGAFWIPGWISPALHLNRDIRPAFH